MAAVGAFCFFALAGYVVENLWEFPTRYCLPHWKSRCAGAAGRVCLWPITFIYGFGGLLFLALRPYVRSLPLPARVVIYGMAFGLLEFGVGWLYYHATGQRVWDYTKSAHNFGGHTDLRHVVYWAFLGLLAEPVYDYLYAPMPVAVLVVLCVLAYVLLTLLQIAWGPQPTPCNAA